MGEDQKTNTHWVLRHIKVWLNPGDKNTFTNTVGLVSCLLWEHVAREKATDHTIHCNTQVSNLIEYPPSKVLFFLTSLFYTANFSVKKVRSSNLQHATFALLPCGWKWKPRLCNGHCYQKISVCAKRILFWG